MKKYWSIWLLTLVAFGIFFHPATAQRKGKKQPESEKVKKTRVTSTEGLKDTTSTSRNIKALDFPNINKIPYYTNKGLFKEVVSANQKKDWEKLYPALKSYVSKFGIINFYKDTYWIWRLAKLAELYGNHEEAKLLYKLVLKHHREDIDIRTIELYYDSLTTNEKDYYVPLEYYYELVDYRKEIDTLRPPRGVLLNMGEFVNSDKADYGPTLSGKDDILIFTSKRNSHHRGVDKVQDEDLFFSKMDDGSWAPAEEFEAVNSQYNEGSACLSKDGNTLFFARCNAPDGYGDCDLYISEKQENGNWGSVRNLGANINSRSWDSHPSLSHSEDTLYFASDRIGGFGLSDIYMSVKNSDGTWQKAINTGPVINTRNNEVSPFYHHVYEVLYFSSNGQNLNFGEFDIYKTYRGNRNAWSEPKNIGPLVNGPGSEFYFTIDSESHNLYYARSTENSLHNQDLFSFPLPMEAQPEAITKFRGSLTNEETGEPLKGIVSIIDLDNGIEVAPKFIRPDGTFEFDLVNHNNYLLIIQGDEFFRIEEIFYLDGEMTLDRTTTPISSKLKFESINFDNAASELTAEMYGDLDKIADFLLDNPDFKLRISGHTDSSGDENYNIMLSQERAESIKAYLTDSDMVPPDRIEAKGFGSSNPIVEENNDADRKLNRRVEFELYRDEKP